MVDRIGRPSNRQEPALDQRPQDFVLGSRSVSRAANWQMEAVRQVRLLMGQGYRRIAAQQQVSSALARSVDDLQTWERELVKTSEYENELLCTELAGELYEYFASGHYTNVPHYKIYGSFGGVYNIARAAGIAKAMRHYSVAEIRTGLRSRRRIDDGQGH